MVFRSDCYSDGFWTQQAHLSWIQALDCQTQNSEQIRHQCSRIMANKMPSRTFACLKKKKKLQLSKQAIKSGKHTNVECMCPRLATMPACLLGIWCRAKSGRTQVVQRPRLCPGPSFLSASCHADLQLLAEVNLCMVGDKLVRLPPRPAWQSKWFTYLTNSW